MNSIVGIVISAVAVLILILIPWVGVGGLNLQWLFGIFIPYAAVLFFFGGMIMRVINWARSPVPFRIPTTGGQQWSLPWIKSNLIDNPKDNRGVVLRMALEILTFRSLFRNTKLQFRNGPKIGYEWEKWLWLGALLFHYAFLVVLVRHLRFFTEPIPLFVILLEKVDGFVQAGIAPVNGFMLPGVLISGFALLAAAAFLFLRRIFVPQVRYISLPTDYFPLLLIIGIAITGILMRYFLKLDIVSVKELTTGLVTFHPKMPPSAIGALFYIHLFLVSVLLAYFPFSKLVHLAGIFLSPTRNLANNSRFVRHINPWNYPVETHTYSQYEDEFRDKMVEAGLPVEKMPEGA